MREAEGYSVITDPALARPIEHDTFTCGHCGGISFTKSKTGGFEVLVFRADETHYMRECTKCRKCWRYICPRCEGKDCSPLMQRVEQAEAAARKGIDLPW